MFSDALNNCLERKRSLVAFNVHNVYHLNALTEAADRLELPCIAQCSARFVGQFEKSSYWDGPFQAGRGMAKQSKTRQLRIAGVPWTISLRKMKAKIDCMKVNPKLAESCFDIRWENKKISGCIHEYKITQQRSEQIGK